VWRYLLLFLGFLTLTLIVWHIGPGKIYEAATQVGPGALLVMLVPSLLMYAFEAYGWKLTLDSAAHGIAFWRIFAIRTAGEVVNMTTPTAYVGGEPLKAYLLQRHQIPMVEGLASVVIAKTIMTLAQVLFILVGIALAFWMLGAEGSSSQIAAAGLLSVALLLFGVVAFIFVQKRGLFMWILGRCVGSVCMWPFSRTARRNYGRWTRLSSISTRSIGRPSTRPRRSIFWDGWRKPWKCM